MSTETLTSVMMSAPMPRNLVMMFSFRDDSQTADLGERLSLRWLWAQKSFRIAALPSDLRKAFGLPAQLALDSGLRPVSGQSPRIIKHINESAERFRTSGGKAAPLSRYILVSLCKTFEERPMKTFLLLLLLFTSAGAFGQTPNQPQRNYPTPVEGDYVIKDFHFRSGEILPELKIHYRTIGTLQTNASGIATNAVLAGHGD